MHVCPTPQCSVNEMLVSYPALSMLLSTFSDTLLRTSYLKLAELERARRFLGCTALNLGTTRTHLADTVYIQPDAENSHSVSATRDACTFPSFIRYRLTFLNTLWKSEKKKGVNTKSLPDSPLHRLKRGGRLRNAPEGAF